jgi:hypothetical protein
MDFVSVKQVFFLCAIFTKQDFTYDFKSNTQETAHKNTPSVIYRWKEKNEHFLVSIISAGLFKLGEIITPHKVLNMPKRTWRVRSGGEGISCYNLFFTISSTQYLSYMYCSSTTVPFDSTDGSIAISVQFPIRASVLYC